MARFGSLGQQYFDDSGDPLSGGSVTFYETGTTTEATTYSDEALTTANANPVILDGAGRQPNIFFSGQLKTVLKDSAGTIVETRDPVGCVGPTDTVGTMPSGATPEIDPKNGTIQEWALTGDSAPSDELVSGESVVLLIDDGSGYTITWPTMEWIGGSEPTLSTTNTYVVILFKVGTQLYGHPVGVAS